MSGATGPPPVFIGGVAGSGKTRLGSLLGRHPNVAVTRKTYFWRRLYGRFGDMTLEENRSRCCEAVVASDGFLRLGLDPDAVRAEVVARAPATYGELFGTVHQLYADKAGKSRWCDQLGLVEVYADPIYESFPDAKVIHLVCDPRAPRFVEQRPWRVGWAVGKWLTSAELAERNRLRYPGNYLVLRFEAFQQNEEETMRQVCGFLDESYDEAIAQAVHAERVDPRAVARSPFIDSRTKELREVHGYTGAGTGDQRTVRQRTHLLDSSANRVALAAWQGLRLRSIDRQLRCIR